VAQVDPLPSTYILPNESTPDPTFTTSVATAPLLTAMDPVPPVVPLLERKRPTWASALNGEDGANLVSGPHGPVHAIEHGATASHRRPFPGPRSDLCAPIEDVPSPSGPAGDQ